MGDFVCILLFCVLGFFFLLFLSFRCYRIFFVSHSRCVVRVCFIQQTIATMKSNFEFFFSFHFVDSSPFYRYSLLAMYVVRYVVLNSKYMYCAHESREWIHIWRKCFFFHHLPLTSHWQRSWHNGSLLKNKNCWEFRPLVAGSGGWPALDTCVQIIRFEGISCDVSECMQNFRSIFFRWPPPADGNFDVSVSHRIDYLFIHSRWR